MATLNFDTHYLRAVLEAPPPSPRKLVAYYDSPTIKQEYMEQVAAHLRRGEISQRTYYLPGNPSRMCAVGATVHGANHHDYERLIGIPAVLALVEDFVHEGLPLSQAQYWPGQFLAAIAPGADLALTWAHTAVKIQGVRAPTLLRMAVGGVPVPREALLDACIEALHVFRSSWDRQPWPIIRDTLLQALADAPQATEDDKRVARESGRPDDSGYGEFRRMINQFIDPNPVGQFVPSHFSRSATMLSTPSHPSDWDRAPQPPSVPIYHDDGSRSGVVEYRLEPMPITYQRREICSDDDYQTIAQMQALPPAFSEERCALVMDEA